MQAGISGIGGFRNNTLHSRDLRDCTDIYVDVDGSGKIFIKKRLSENEETEP